jgi:hypothetical protein
MTNIRPVYEVDDDRAHTPIQLIEKNIEPAVDNLPEINRNFQLGNIQDATFSEFRTRLTQISAWRHFPQNYGGWLSNWLAQEELTKIEYALILSGSRRGFVREMNQTQKTDAKVTQNTNGIFGGLFGEQK